MNPGLIPPAEVAAAAKRGLELRQKFRRGGTSVGARRARELADRRSLSLRDVVAMSAYFARHEVDKAAMSHEWGDESDPSAGYIAWMLWGGEPAPLGRWDSQPPEQDRGRNNRGCKRSQKRSQMNRGLVDPDAQRRGMTPARANSILQEASECRVDRHCDRLSIHSSGTNSHVRSNARGAGQRRVAPRPAPRARFGCCHCIAVVRIQEPGAIQKVGGAHHRDAAPQPLGG